MARASQNKRPVKRSSLYHLIHTNSPANHAISAKVDLWGAAIVVSIMIAGVLLMRTLLAVQ